MKRKFFAILLVAMLTLAVLTPSIASACESREMLNYGRACSIVNVANVKIRALVMTAQLTPYDDVEWLVDATEAVARSATRQVNKLGLEVKCEYRRYFVDGRWVLIDPLHVINPLQ